MCGGSTGIGAAFASALASRGVNVALVARRAEVVRSLAESLPGETLCITQDLAEPDAPDRILAHIDDREVGLLVYNAALSLVGPFFDQPLHEHVRELDTNCRTPLALAYELGKRMARRGHGGIVLVSSLAGMQGSPFIAHYAATKAWNIVLAEGLWAELSPPGVDILACVAGAVATPGYAATAGAGSRFAPRPLTPEQVAEEALAGLGRGPTVVPGAANRLAAQIIRRLLPRVTAIKLMGSNTRGLEPTQRGR